MEDLDSRYYITNNSLNEEVAVDKNTGEMIKSDSLIKEVRNSYSINRIKEFKEIKEAYLNHFIAYDSEGNEVIVNRETGEKETDKVLIDKVNFGIAWVDSKGLSIGISPDNLSKIDEIHRVHQAFLLDESLTYSSIIREVQEQLRQTGKMDTVSLNYRAEKSRHALTVELYEYLLNEPRYLISLYNWVKDLTPEAFTTDEDLTTLSGKKVNSMSHKLN